MSENLSYLSGRKGLKEGLFGKLVEAGEKTGTPGKEEMKALAEDYLMGEANVLGAASFYDFLHPEHVGKKAYVCNGSACLLAGTQDAVHHQLEQHFSKDEIGHMCCLGRCHENAAFNVNGINYSGKDAENLGNILKGEGVPSAEKYFVGSGLDAPILTAEFPGIEAYYRVMGDALKRDAGDLLEEIKLSKLAGRGGAGFPTWFKLDACRKEIGDKKFIVCNADEGDPGAYSDRYLMELQPHSVLFGMMVAGRIVGADTGVLYIRAEYPESVSVMDQAIKDLREAGWIGQNIQGSDFNFDFKVVKGAGSYVCGEESALLSSLEGQRPEVRIRPPYPAQKGLFNLPTIVSNVETFANFHYILKHGGEHFASIGTERSTGTKLVCFDSFFNRPGLFEAEMGTPLRKVVEEYGQGFKSPVKALHIGGPLGGLVPTRMLDELTLDFETFKAKGFELGHGSFLSVPEEYPLVKYLEHLFEFTAVESCGKCFPCRLGSVRGQEMLAKAQAEDYKIPRQLMVDLLETLEQGSLCALGGAIPLPVKNAMKYFEPELNPYFS